MQNAMIGKIAAALTLAAALRVRSKAQNSCPNEFLKLHGRFKQRARAINCLDLPPHQKPLPATAPGFS